MKEEEGAASDNIKWQEQPIKCIIVVDAVAVAVECADSQTI